jgi:hypothetical protein
LLTVLKKSGNVDGWQNVEPYSTKKPTKMVQKVRKVSKPKDARSTSKPPKPSSTSQQGKNFFSNFFGGTRQENLPPPGEDVFEDDNEEEEEVYYEEEEVDDDEGEFQPIQSQQSVKQFVPQMSEVSILNQNFFSF